MTLPKRRLAKPDAIDMKMLATLHRDGRISKTKLSTEIGLSATRCWERMRRMEDEGIIAGYHADISLRRLAGLSLFMVEVKLADKSLAGQRRFERSVQGVDAVIGCEDVLGVVDYILTVAASGVEAYQAVIERLSSQDGMKFEYVTFPIAKRVKSPSSISLEALLSRMAAG